MNQSKQNNNNSSKKSIARSQSVAIPKRNGNSRDAALARAPKARRIDFRISAGRQSKPGSIRITGQDYISVINGNSQSFNNLFNRTINPSSEIFFGTRLNLYSKMFEKFLFRRLRFHYDSGVSATTTGSLILAYDRDATDGTPPNNETGLRQYLSMANSEIGNVWEDITIDCKLADLQEFYYTSLNNSDARLTSQGQIYVTQVNGASSGTASLGSLWVDYDIEFFDPAVEQPTGIEFVLGNTDTGLTYTVTGGSSGSWNNMLLGSAILKNDLGVKYSGAAVQLPSGNYILTQTAMNASNIAQAFTATILSPLSGAESGTVTMLWNGTATGINQFIYRVERLIVPASGAWISGCVTNTGSISAPRIQFIAVPDSTFY